MPRSTSFRLERQEVRHVRRRLRARPTRHVDLERDHERRASIAGGLECRAVRVGRHEHERSRLVDGGLGDQLLDAAIALIVHHVEREDVAVDDVLVGDVAARIGRHDRVLVNDSVRPTPTDVVWTVVDGHVLRPASLGQEQLDARGGPRPIGVEERADVGVREAGGDSGRDDLIVRGRGCAIAPFGDRRRFAGRWRARRRRGAGRTEWKNGESGGERCPREMLDVHGLSFAASP